MYCSTGKPSDAVVRVAFLETLEVALLQHECQRQRRFVRGEPTVAVARRVGEDAQPARDDRIGGLGGRMGSCQEQRGDNNEMPHTTLRSTSPDVAKVTFKIILTLF